MIHGGDRIKIGIIITIASLLLSGLGAVFAYGIMPNRADLSDLRREQKAISEKYVDKERYSCDMARIEHRLDRMDEKLDRQHAEIMQSIRP